MGISLRQAARECGVKHQSLMKAAKVGTLVLEPDGTVDMAKLRESEWRKNREGKAPGARPIPKMETPPPGTAKQKAEAPAPGDERARKLERMRRLLQIENVELLGTDKINLEKLLILERRESLRLDNEERRGNLVRRADVEERWLRVASAIRNRMLIFEGKLASKLVGIADVFEARRIISSEVREVLTILSETRPDAAA